jgi:hypothetical protein
MWQKIFNAFFLGQVALETATEASRKRFELAREKAVAYKEKAEEYKGTKVAARAEQFAKEKFAKLRSSSEPFEATCLKLASFLGETADIKTKLATESHS